MKNNIRFDLSDYLIHFFRDVDLETGSHIYLPEHCGFNNQHHACFIDAKYLLRLSLRSHKIFSSWSYRNGQRTVYGDSPVVCFTDMPIAAYLETGVRRLERKEKIGLYAIVLPKEQMFNYGQGQSYMGWMSITMLDARKAETGNVFLMKRLFL